MNEQETTEQGALGVVLKRTPEQVRKDFRRRGITFSDWAKENGFSPSAVYQVLGGQRKCLRGKSFEIAQKLGIS